ncbi:MAG: aspartate-semialdehyde dehydrogenase [Pseudobdellovibrionaceae bacterium]
MMTNPRKLKIGVVGATGMVGKSFMETLEQRKFPVELLRPFASEASLGKSITLQGKSYPIEVLKPGCFEGLNLVFFSSGDDISKEWAPQAVASGAWAVDNSAAFRMDPQTHLVVPEVNGDLLTTNPRPQIIANPNCSTIQLVVALKPLLRDFGIKEVKVSSYQAVSGAGQAAFDELLVQTKQVQMGEKVQSQNFAHQIAFNCIPQIGSFNDEGFTSEEVKVQKETKKILRAPHIHVSAFTVRVPVLNAHAETVWVTLDKEVTRDQLLASLKSESGLVVQDNAKGSDYPLQIQVSGKDPVYVGRIHRDPENPKLWLMWVVSDNIRKGAALNGIQIAERIFDIH